jgi:2-methylfumaryl-CoA hydratase
LPRRLNIHGDIGVCHCFAWSEVLARAELPGRTDVGALRLRTVATKDHPCHDFPLRNGNEDDPAVVLELDYWVLLPR